jgi:hypothetical protein
MKITFTAEIDSATLKIPMSDALQMVALLHSRAKQFFGGASITLSNDVTEEVKRELGELGVTIVVVEGKEDKP